MSEKKLPFTKQKLEKIIQKFPTPFHIYDEVAIRENVQRLRKAFSWVPNFKEYYAVKACPNPSILKILKEEGCGADCSSFGELMLSEKVGIIGEEIMFTSNDTSPAEFKKAKELGAIINFDDISHIEYFEKNIGALPDLACLRYNPGALKEGNAIIGNPEDAKYGLTREQIFEAYKLLQLKGVTRFGIHTMVASNELNPDYFAETANILFELVKDIKDTLNIEIEFINLGGGIGIPYKPEDEPVNLEYVSEQIKKEYDSVLKANGLTPNIVMEMGRMITGPYGYLVSKVEHMKHTYKDYVGLDSCMANLMRPALYGSYHHITVVGKENNKADHLYDVTGSLCENNDKFAIDRKLPKVEQGDLIVIHDTGAHGHAMGFNYNAKLRSAELLLQKDGSVRQIRRAETLDDYFATLDFDNF